MCGHNAQNGLATRMSAKISSDFSESTICRTYWDVYFLLSVYRIQLKAIAVWTARCLFPIFDYNPFESRV